MVFKVADDSGNAAQRAVDGVEADFYRDEIRSAANDYTYQKRKAGKAEIDTYLPV